MSGELRYGPNTAAVERMLERLRSATAEELRTLADVSRDADRDCWEDAWRAASAVAWEAGRGIGRGAVDPMSGSTNIWNVVWGAVKDVAIGARHLTWNVTSGAIEAVIICDLISPEDFATLTDSWAEVFGPTWEEKNRR